MPRPLALLVNPSAGGGRAVKALPAVEAELRRLGLAHRVAMTESVRHAKELAVAAAGAETVVPFSGDGLVGAVAAALRGHDDAVMGVLPGGRGNDFCRTVGIPRDPVAACAVLAAGVATPVDLGEVVSDGGASHEPQTFIGIASLGFDSAANRIANDAPSTLGPLVYAYGALRALATFRPATFDVSVDRERRTFSGWSVGACNTSFYGGGMKAAPDARLDDGQLDVMMASPRSRAEFLTKLLPGVFKGTHTGLPFVSMMRGAEVRIAADRPFTVYADGDPIGELPATIRAVPGAVKVLLPAA
jgi:YegS/Rv2252/BmrU family lipid kinase